MRAGDVLVIDLPTTESLRIAARITRKLAGKRLLGICVFRLPDYEPATLNVNQVSDALKDQDSHAVIWVSLKRQLQFNDTRLFILTCKNGGSVSPIIGSLQVDLIVPAGSFEGIRSRPGVSIQPLCAAANGPQPCSERRADILRVTVDYLAPANTFGVTLLLNRELPQTTRVSVAMQTETGQAYSAQYEIFIEAGVK